MLSRKQSLAHDLHACSPRWLAEGPYFVWLTFTSSSASTGGFLSKRTMGAAASDLLFALALVPVINLGAAAPRSGPSAVVGKLAAQLTAAMHVIGGDDGG